MHRYYYYLVEQHVVIIFFVVVEGIMINECAQISIEHAPALVGNGAAAGRGTALAMHRPSSPADTPPDTCAGTH